MWDRGMALMGFVGNWRGGFLALVINSVIQVILGIGFTITGQLWRDADARVFQIMGPIMLLVGIGLGIGAVYARARARQIPRSEVKLTSEATQLLYRILGHIGWHYDQNRYSASANQWNHWMSNVGLSSILGRKTSSQILRPETFEILDRAAANFNRAHGVFKANKRSDNASLSRMIPAAQAAADEAMISIFNQIAILERTPESSIALQKQIDRDLSNLKELSDRVEHLAGGPQSLTEQYTSTTAMQSVLEQLRYDAAAREELVPDDETVDDDPLRKRLKQGD